MDLCFSATSNAHFLMKLKKQKEHRIPVADRIFTTC